MKTMDLAVSLSAYATVALPAGTEMTPENLKSVAKQMDSDGDVTFAPDWGTMNSFRIVSCKKGDELVVEDLPIAPSYHDVGTNFTSWMLGHQSLADAILSSTEMLPTSNVGIVEVFTGFVKVAGAGRLQVDFECRKGATSEEQNLAFLDALEKVVEVGYVALGEQPGEVASACEAGPAPIERSKG